MDITTLLTQLDAAVSQHVGVASDDPAVEAAAEALLSGLRPALQQLALGLAEQAAAEMKAQLPGRSVDVVLAGGEPSLVIRSADESEATYSGEHLAARITLRLPTDLKAMVEQAAAEAGDSVNTYLVKTLSQSAAPRSRRSSRRITGRLDT